jgi:hypothetical protein
MSRLPEIKSGFKGPIYAKPSPEDGPEFDRLTEPLAFHSWYCARTITVPKGFPTDYASFRIGDLELHGQTKRPAVFHDDAYASGRWPKVIADLLFYEACRTEGMGRFRAGLRFAAVVLSKKAHRAWKAHRRGTTPGARFYRALNGPPDNTSTTNHP